MLARLLSLPEPATSGVWQALPEPFLNWTAGWWKRCDGGERRIDGWRLKGYPTETVWIFDARTDVPGIIILVSSGTGGCGAFLVERLPAEAEPTRREGRDYEPAEKLLERVREARHTPQANDRKE